MLACSETIFLIILRNGTIAEALRIVGFTSQAIIVKYIIDPEDKNTPGTSILKEVLIVFLSNIFSLLALLYVSSHLVVDMG